MAIIKKTDNKFWVGCGETGILIHCWKNRKGCEYFEKQFGGIVLPYDPAFYF